MNCGACGASRPLRCLRRWLSLALLSLLLPPGARAERITSLASPAAATQLLTRSPEAALSRAKLAYERGDYTTAIALLRPLLYPSALLPDEGQVLLAHKLLGLSFFFEGQNEGAEQEFNALLSLRPDFTLDPLVDPVKAVAFLDSIRRRNQERLGELRRQQEQTAEHKRREAAERQRAAEALQRQQAQRIYIERVVHKRFTPLLFVPFGAPQLADHRPVVGGLLLGGETLLGTASLGSWLIVRLRYPGGSFPPADYNLARALTATYLTTGVLFWGTVLTGLVDALLHARTVVEVHELPGPPKEQPPHPRRALRLVPLPTSPPGGLPGLSLTLIGEFP